ncbi:MAG: hypothetical protein U0930_24435 [Pirellulales bacterium]
MRIRVVNWAVGGLMSETPVLTDFGYRLNLFLRGFVEVLPLPRQRRHGKQVVTGYRFVLEAKPKEEWLKWQPRIATGSTTRANVLHPLAIRVVTTWKTSMLGIPKRHSEKSWGLVMEDGTLVVLLPADLLESSSRDDGRSCRYQLHVNSRTVKIPGLVSQFKMPVDLPESYGVERWKKELVGEPGWKQALATGYNPELSGYRH